MRCEDHYLLHIEVRKCMHSVSFVSLSNLAQRCGNIWTNTRSLFLCVYTNIESLVEVVPVPIQANTHRRWSYAFYIIICISGFTCSGVYNMKCGYVCLHSSIWQDGSPFFVVLWRWQVSVSQFRPLDRRYFKQCSIFFVKSIFQVLKHSIPRLLCRVCPVGCFQHSYRFTFFISHKYRMLKFESDVIALLDSG
jgi:hypothetical protein